MIKATESANQTNIPLLLMMLYDFGEHIRTEKILFADAFTSTLTPPEGAIFRRVTEAEMAEQQVRGAEVGCPWMVEKAGKVVAEGGFLTHYNPPYGDVFMETHETARRRGF